MGLRIQNNVEAFNAHRQLSGTAAKAAKSMEKLSSGYRVNRAADDAAGLLDVLEIDRAQALKVVEVNQLGVLAWCQAACAAALVAVVLLLALWPILERRRAWSVAEEYPIQTPK